MKSILLSNGSFTIVDDDVYLWASKMKWSCRFNGYIQSTKGQQVLLHRLIMDAPKGMDVDHINHFRWDNRRKNLRLCTRSENMMNRIVGTRCGRGCRTKFSKYKGVAKQDKKWSVRLSVAKKQIYLGRFPTEKVAALVYNKAALFYYGEFANLNIIDKD